MQKVRLGDDSYDFKFSKVKVQYIDVKLLLIPKEFSKVINPVLVIVENTVLKE